MAKDPESPYTPGRRGLAWLKLKKAFATLDVVVVAVEFGHGKRREVLSDYTFSVRDTEHDRLVTVGKAYTGLTDVEIAALTEHFLQEHPRGQGPPPHRRAGHGARGRIRLDPAERPPRERLRAALPPDQPDPHRQDGGRHRHPGHLPPLAGNRAFADAP
jgi:ATP-dependent DNA ligase